MDSSLLNVQIKGLLPTPSGSGVFLKGEGKAITIFIDQMGTRAFQCVLNNQQPPRPLSHELLSSVLSSLGVHVLHVVIYALEEETFFARLHLQQDNEVGKKYIEIDARPSDCMILALQNKAPVFIDRDVWDAADDMSWAIKHLSS